MRAIILAAGFSRRFGGAKLLASLHQKPIVAHVMDQVLQMGFAEIVLIYQAEEVGKLAELRNIKHIFNEQAAQGISTSIRCGVSVSGPAEAYIFFMGDQPWIDKDTVARLQDSFLEGKASIVAPRYNGNPGNPVIFGAVWRQELLALSGDRGGRVIMENHPDQVYWLEIPNARAGQDIDTIEDYLKFKAESQL